MLGCSFGGFVRGKPCLECMPCTFSAIAFTFAFAIYIWQHVDQASASAAAAVVHLLSFVDAALLLSQRLTSWG
jgi:hypothetical protein